MNEVMKMARKEGITKSLTREQNDELYKLIVTKDQDAIKQMIEGNMALVMLKVETLLSEMPGMSYLRDDLISEGLRALTEAVHSMSNKPYQGDANPTGYLYVSIRREINHYVDREVNLSASNRQLTRSKNKLSALRDKANVLVALSDQRALTDEEHDEYDDLTRKIQKAELSTREDVDFYTLNIAINPMEMVDMRDVLNVCARDSNEMVMLKMLEEGHTLTDIAKTVNIPIASAHKMREELYERVCAKAGLTPKKRK